MIWAIFAVGIFAMFAVWPRRSPDRKGKIGKDVQRPLRGSWVVKEEQGRRLWSEALKDRGLDQAGLVPFGSGFIPPEAECQHCKIVGTTGSGKSTAIKHTLSMVEHRPGQRCVVVDPDGGYARLFFNESRGDRILNPFDERTSGWNLGADVREDYEARHLAAALVPDASGDSGEWKAYAQTLVSAAILALRKRGALTPESLYTSIVLDDYATLAALVEGSPAARYFSKDNERMLGSVRSVAGTALAGLSHVKNGDFSLSEYARGEDRGWVFLTYQASQIAELRGVVSAWMRLAIFSLMSRAEGDSGTWLIIDELDSLGKISGLTDALPRLRKFGGRCVLAFQSIGPLTEIYGHGFSAAVVENASNTLILRCSDSGERSGGTAQFASSLIGQREVMRTTSSTSETQGSSLQHGLRIAPGTNRSKVSGTNTAPMVESAVLPAQIEGLENLKGYVHSHGMPFWSRCALPLFEREPKAEAFVPRAAGEAESKESENE
jgi:energy-coupling factor transporter ATP-binding protein EcfA2